jgi:hypothetical protein
MAKKNEDNIQRSVRLVRDRAFRACGENPYDETYQGILWALQQVRQELRSNVKI